MQAKPFALDGSSSNSSSNIARLEEIENVSLPLTHLPLLYVYTNMMLFGQGVEFIRGLSPAAAAAAAGFGAAGFAAAGFAAAAVAAVSYQLIMLIWLWLRCCRCCCCCCCMHLHALSLLLQRTVLARCAMLLLLFLC